MSHLNSFLPKEVAALVQHVELNRSGWWERTVQRLTLAAIWLSDHPLSKIEISHTLKDDFRLPLSEGKVSAALTALQKQDLVVILPNGSYRIPEPTRKLLELDIKAAEDAANAARAFFISLVESFCPELDAEATWGVFESDFLAPLLKDVGANAYHLIAGERIDVDKTLADRFLNRFEPKCRNQMAETITAFLDPRKAEVRAHISRMLNARFCVEAGGLPEAVIERLNASIGKQVRFRVFLDTNFLFSLLELHENPSNEAARELNALIAKLGQNPKVQLYVIPRTIDEAKSAISLAKLRVTGVPSGDPFTQAALRTGISGMGERFFSERMARGGNLSPEHWFDPYLSDFLAMARGKGVELFNESTEAYSMRQDVIDDIHVVKEFEKRTYEEGKRKSYEKIAHDMILWHFVRDKRPAYIESPLEAQEWILTVDYRLLGFDEHKLKKTGAKVPLCLHPASFIQLLQFWVPRNQEFEEAMLGSLRLPFLFQEFDAVAEKTSLKILKGLGRFAASGDMSESTITSVVLNEGLRARLKTDQPEEAEIALIRDAIVEETKRVAEAEKMRADQLKAEIAQKDAALEELGAKKDAELRLKEAELNRLAARLTEEASRAAASDGLRAQKEAEVTELAKELARSQESEQRRHELLVYAGCLVVIVFLSGLAAWGATLVVPYWAGVLGPYSFELLVATVVFLVGHLLLESWARHRRQQMTLLWPFKQVRRFRKWLWLIVVLGFMVGVIGNLYANRIQRNMDQQLGSTPQREMPAPTSTGASK